MRSVQIGGFTFDIGGSHVIYSKDKEVLEFILNLLKSNRIKNKRNTKILYKNRYIGYPFENSLSDLSKEENFECLYDLITNLIIKEKDKRNLPSNLKKWFYYSFGKSIAEKYLIPYNNKIWKYPLDRISLELVERIPNPPIEDIIKSSLGIKTVGYKHQLYFYYPKYGGIHAVIKSLENKLENKIFKKFEVQKIKREDDKWIVSDGHVKRHYDKLISTIPIHDLVNCLDFELEKEVVEAVNSLKYNSLITVMIGVNARISHLSWMYIPNKNVLAHKFSFQSNYSPFVAPEKKSSILAEITCRQSDNIWRMKDSEIIDFTLDELNKLRIIDKSKVCYSLIKRLKYAYIIYDLNYKKNITIALDYCQRIGIDVLGRFAEFKYLNMDECIRKAMDYIKMKIK